MTYQYKGGATELRTTQNLIESAFNFLNCDLKLNIKCPQLSKPKARQQWQGTKTSSGDWMDAL